MAAAYDVPVVPHGSAFFSTHFQMAHVNSPFQEVLAMSPDGMDFVSIYGNVFKASPFPRMAGWFRRTSRGGAWSWIGSW